MLSWTGPFLAYLLLAGPIVFGLAGTLLPAFGYLPALGGTRFTLIHFIDLAQMPGIATSVLVSFVAGLATTAISLMVVMLFVAGWAGTRLFSQVLHLISPLLSVPHAAAAFGFAFLVAPSGMIARFLSPDWTGWQRPPDLLVIQDPMGLAMIAGLVIKEIPFLLLITLAALPQARLHYTRALTASLGYGRVAGFILGIWPSIYRQIRLGVFAVLVFATSVVDVAIILGPTSPPTLAARLVGWMNSPEVSMRFVASAGAVLQLALTAATLIAWIGIERIAGRLCIGLAARGRRMPSDALVRQVGLAAILACAGVVVCGLALLGLWSAAGRWPFPDLLPQTFTTRSWAAAAPRMIPLLATTMAVAGLASAIATIIAVLYFMREDRSGGRPAAGFLLLYLPLLVPQAAFLFGLQLLFLLAGIVPGLAALVLAHLVFVLPYVLLSLAEPWRAFDRRYETVATGLGRPRLLVMLRVKLPMLTRAIVTAAAVGFAVSVGQYLPTLLIGAGRVSTITTEAVALASGGNRRVIGVFAFAQMLLPAVGFMLATMLPAVLFRRRRAMRV